MKFAEITRTEERVQGGGWVGDLVNLPGVRLKVRGLANPDFQRLRSKLQAGVKEGEVRDTQVVADEDAQLLRDTILVDWDGIEDMPYSAEAATEALKTSVFRNAAYYAATVVASQGKNEIEDVTKNS